MSSIPQPSSLLPIARAVPEELTKTGGILTVLPSLRKSLDVPNAESVAQVGVLESAIFESANFLSIVTDAEGVIQAFGAGATRLLGYSPEDVVGKLTPVDLSDSEEIAGRAAALGAEFATPIERGFQALVFKASKRPEDVFELTCIGKDGRRLPTVISVTSLRDAQGVIRGYFLIGTDNTARKQAEQDRAELERRLEAEDVSRMKAEFLANMSHELRTPLNAIIGFSEMLKDGLMGEVSLQQHASILGIFKSGKHLLSLVDDILDLAKVESGQMTLDLETMQVSSLFGNGLSVIREKAASRQLRLTIDVSDDLDRFDADVCKVKQIVYNLISNAVKFTNDGGQVSVYARRVTRNQVGRGLGLTAGRWLALSDNEFANFLELDVADTGIGISRQALTQLFQPFNQIDAGPARKFEGTGLGLAMVKLLTELHGGTVGVQSALGEGSRFTVWLPLREPLPDWHA